MLFILRRDPRGAKLRLFCIDEIISAPTAIDHLMLDTIRSTLAQLV